MTAAGTSARTTDRRLDVAFVALLAALVAVYIAPALRTGGMLGAYPSDGARLHYFVREYLLESIAAGRLPLWNPFTQFGAPFLANMQWGVFYPLNFLLAHVPTALAYNLFIAIHLWLAGAFMYWLARDWTLDAAPAFVAGVAFMFSGRLISMAWGGGVNHLSALAWLPLVVLCFSRAASADSLRPAALWTAACSAAWAIQVLSGHPQYSCLSALVMLALAVWIATQRNRGADRLIPFGVWLAIIAVGVALSAVQLAPTYEAMALSTRSFAWSVSPLTASFDGSYNPIRVVTWLTPDLFGNTVSLHPASTDWLSLVLKEPHSDEFRGYIGILPLALAVLTLSDWRRDRRVAILWSLVVASLLLAAGSLTPVYGLFYRIAPPFRVFRIPARFLNIVVFAMALLAGVGAQRLLGDPKASIRVWTKTIAAFAAVLVAGVAISFAARTEILAYGLRLASPIFAVRPSGFGLDAAARSGLVTRAFALGLRSVLTTAVWLALTAAIFRSAATRNRNAVALWIVVVTVADLGVQASMYASAEPMAVHYAGNSALIALLRRAPEQSRTYTFAPPDPSMRPDPIRPSDNVFMHEHLLTAAGYDSFELQTYRSVRDLLDADLNSNSTYVASLFGVQYIASTTALASTGMRPVGEAGTARIYENARSLPRFYMAGRAARVSDPEAALARVRNHDLRLGDEVLVESADDVPQMPAGSIGRVALVTSHPEEIELRAHADRDGYLVVNDSFYPGWTAFVDGQPARVLRANGAVRAVAVTAGDHRVTMTFAPALLAAGWRITATAAGALTLLVAGLLFIRNSFVTSVLSRLSPKTFAALKSARASRTPRIR